MRFFVLPLVLAAAVSAEMFHFVGQNGQGSTLYNVYGAVTVGANQLTGKKAVLAYKGVLAVLQVVEGEYMARFTQFTISKYDRISWNIKDETFGNLEPEEQRLVETLREDDDYQREMQKPVKFYMKNGQVVRMEAGKEHSQWSLNIFRGIFTLFQNQVQRPYEMAIPYIDYKYEDGVAGNCKVQYEVFSQPEYGVGQGVLNITKTTNYKDCLSRPVYLHLKDTQRGCAGVCDNHNPENFLGQYEEERTDHEMKPTPGCPVNQQRSDTLVTVQTVTKYNVSWGYLDGAHSEHTDIYHLFGDRFQVFTALHLHHNETEGPMFDEPQNVETYDTLQQHLPHEDELAIPIYALMKQHGQHQQYPRYFQRHFETVIHELRQIKEHQNQGQNKNYDAPAYLVELIQAISGMTEHELKETVPAIVRQKQPKQLDEEEYLRRQLWIELLGKAGSKTAVKIAVELIKNNIFTPAETRRILQDIAAFQSYPDTDMIERVLDLCLQSTSQAYGQSLTSIGKATACVAAGKIISKGCNSKIYQLAQKHQQEKKLINSSRQTIHSSEHGYEVEPEASEYRLTMGHLPIQPQYLCTSEKLQQYVKRLSQALSQATEFRTIIAYINGLAKIEKPEALPKLISYVEGTAQNLKFVKQEGEDEDEATEFVRRVAILSLRNIAFKYPKEVNPIVRVIYQNTTEKVQTRIVAFDVWMNTQPAQWEVEKVMQVANKDSSRELTHYVYTALKTAMSAQEPCYKLLAERIRAVWTQIRPFDFGMKFSQLRSMGYYSYVENYGIRGIWKMIASNTTMTPGYTEAKFEQVRGPFIKSVFGGKVLIKGGNSIWEQVVGKNDLLEHVACVLSGHTQQCQQDARRLFKDIAQGMGVNKYNDETPKAVLYWNVFAGEAIIPIDGDYLQEFNDELRGTISSLGRNGLSGHYLRVFLPTKAFHVEPTNLGFPIVHSTIHPVVFSVRYENLKLQYNKLAPYKFEFTGTVQPTILSFRQTRVFAAERQGHRVPTMKVTDIKEFNPRFSFQLGYIQSEHRFYGHIKPIFDRVFHSGHCTELKLEANNIIDAEPYACVVDYGNCIKTLYDPIHRNQQIGGQWLGMVLRLAGESHQSWSGPGTFSSQEARQEGLFAAALNHFANNGMKHHAMSLYLEPDKRQPINEWSAVIDLDSNLERLAKVAISEQAQKIQKVKAEYKSRQQPINVELQEVIRKVDNLLENTNEEIDETTIESQILVKIQGSHQGQPKCTINVAMKKVHNFESTKQVYALAVEHKESNNNIELFANVSYPKIGSPFHYDPTYFSEDQRMNGTFIAKFQGQQEQTYRVSFQAVKSEEQKKGSNYEWFEVRCLAEQKAGKTMTDTCKKAILKANSLDAMSMTIHLPRNVDPKAKSLAYQTLDFVKYQLYPKMQSKLVSHKERQQQLQKYQNGKQEIYISANATRDSASSLLYNVHLEMPFEDVMFSKIRLPGLRPIHMQLSSRQQLEHVAYRGQNENVCVLGDKYVRTYDNVTLSLDVMQGCEYVLTRHQSENDPVFTVTFEVVKPNSFAKKIRVQLYDQVIEFIPFVTTDRYFQVIINGNQHQLTFNKPIAFVYGNGQRVYLNAYETPNPHDAPVVDLYTESEEFGVHFDGHAAKVYINGKYKGSTYGVCGNNDNEQKHEFIGPNSHEYERSNEFIAAYGIGQRCKVPAQNSHEKQMEILNQEIEQIRRQEQVKTQLLSKQMQDSYTQQNERSQQLGQQQNEFNRFWMEQQNEQFWGKQHGQEEEWDSEKEQEQRQILKTVVSIENDHVCFSSRPIATCKLGYHHEGVLRIERVESICLEKNHGAAIEAIKQIRAKRTIDVTSLAQYQKGRLFTMHNVPKCKRYE
ncbi:uncharacterized protein LOC111272963 [Varroa jacobsoni]|uniref:uncharacterized protein LOC111272963 n=1 Tax=Varroa jacobsoni TaxID=62625 RepID=UPI000BF7D666|nr:uncharacterized protein LOC111272963 [Varroa jacobsoni]